MLRVLALAAAAAAATELRQEALNFACRPLAPKRGKAVRTAYLGPVFNGALVYAGDSLVVTQNAQAKVRRGQCHSDNSVKITVVECGQNGAATVARTLDEPAARPSDAQCANELNHALNDPMDTRLLALGDDVLLLSSEIMSLSDSATGRTQWIRSLSLSDYYYAVSSPKPLATTAVTIEKDWVPFAVNQTTMATFRWLVDDENRSVVNTEGDRTYYADARGLRDLLTKGSSVSGGTNAVRLNETHYLAFGHTKTTVPVTSAKVDPRWYRMFAYLFLATPPFTIVAATHDFNLRASLSSTNQPPFFFGRNHRASLGEDTTFSDSFAPDDNLFDAYTTKKDIHNLSVQFPMALSLVHTRSDDDDQEGPESAADDTEDDDDRAALLVWGSEDTDTFLSVLSLPTLLLRCHRLRG